MAETELAIVVRARDQLTATLRQMGTTVDELARKVAADFQNAGRATDSIVSGVRQSATATQGLAGEASRAAEQMRALGQADTSRLQIAISTTRAEVERLRAAAATDLIPGDAAAKAEQLEQELRGAEQALASLKKTGAEIDIATRIAQAEQAVLSLGQNASLAPLEAEIARAQVELQAMREQATRAGGAISELDRQRLNRLAADVREGEQALVRLRGGTDQAREGASLLGSTFSTVAAGIKAALLPILPILTLAGAAFAAQRSVSEALALEDALSRINAEANLTKTELDTLRQGALQTARALGLSESKAAPALLDAVTDGAANAADGLGRFQAAARLAAARGEDVGKVTDALTSILNAYRGANLDAARASDVLFEVARAGKVEVEELAGSLEAVLPLASQIGVSFEELGAILVTATQKGGGLAQGMQAVRAVLGTLTDAGPDARKALEGIDFSASRIRAEGLVPVLQDISAKLHGNAEAIRAVFPDGRAFGAVLALLGDRGAGLSRSLEQLANSSGAVEQALGRRLQDPVFQLGVLFNSLRSSFADAFGGAFLRGVQAAIAQMGGLEAATKGAQEIGKTLGDVFGVVFPAIGTVIGQAADALRDFIASIGGAEQIGQVFKAVGDTLGQVLGSALKIARAEIEALIRTILLIPQAILAGKDELEAAFSPFSDAQTEAAAARYQIELLDKAIAGLSSGTFDRGAFLTELKQFLNQGGLGRDQSKVLVDIAFNEPKIDTALLERAKGQVEASLAGIEVDIDKGQAFERLAESAQKIPDALRGVDGEVASMDAALEGLFSTLGKGAQAAQRAVGEIAPPEIDFAAAEEQVRLFEGQLAALRAQAQDALSAGLDGDALSAVFAVLGSDVEDVQRKLVSARAAAAGFKAELEAALESKVAAKKGEIAELAKGLRDARSQAKLLGVEGTEAAKALGAGFNADKIERAREELAALEAELTQLRGETVVVGVRFGTDLDDLLAGFKDIGAKIAARFDPGTLARLGKQAGEELRDSILAGVGSIDPFEETLRLFRGGIEPSLGRQVQLIEEQVDRQRDATQSLREALPVLRALGLLSQQRLDMLDEETDKLAQSAGLLQRRAALEAAGLRRQALELGIDPKLDDDELRVAIDETRDKLEREHLAIALGVEIDDESIEAARRELQERADSLELRQVKRDAAFFGLALDGRAVEQLKSDIADAQEDAQDFADTLQGRGLRSEALALGISIDGKSEVQIEQDIRELQTRAQEFANAHPIEAELLTSAINGGSQAFAQFITGAKSGKEALRDFFTSMAAQAAQAAAQLLIVKSLISAFGASSGIGSFLATTFPGAAASARGNAFALGGDVVALATGGAITARAVATHQAAPVEVMSFARGGSPERAHRSPDAPLWTAPTYVERFAMGGSPWSEKIVDRPTLERSERLAGSAIVPLSGGGVATTGGGRLPVEKRGSELVVMRQAAAHALGGAPGEQLEAVVARAYASGGAPWALFGEAGREGVMKMHRAPDGRAGIRAADGAVLPLTRVEGGRLGVEAHAAGQLFGVAERFALGGLLDQTGPIRDQSGIKRLPLEARAAVSAYTLGGVLARAGSSEQTPREVAAFALGGSPAVADAIRHARTLVEPFALGGAGTEVAAYASGGAPDVHRALWTAPQAFEAGGFPDVRRTLETLGVPFKDGGFPDATRTMRTVVAPFAAGGVPDAWRTIRADYQPVPVQAYAMGGSPSSRGAPVASAVGISVSVPVQLNVAAPPSGPAVAREERPEEFGARIQVAISRSSAVREVIAGVVLEEINRRPSGYGGAVRGDRA